MREGTATSPNIDKSRQQCDDSRGRGKEELRKSAAMRFTYRERLAALRAAKQAQTREKWQLIGSMDHDDWALVLPPPDRREVVQTISGSGMPITDVKLKGYEPKANHPSGGFFGARAVGENFRALMDAHPPYVDPNSSLAGAYMANFMSYRKPHWNPDIEVPQHLRDLQAKYQLGAGIGATQHFCQDLAIGLRLGWGGLLDKIHHYQSLRSSVASSHASRITHHEVPSRVPRPACPETEFYAGLEQVVLGMQDWLRRTAAAAREMAKAGKRRAVRRNLSELAEINERLVTEPPRTFREACQWMLWYQMAARMFNGSGSLGRLDTLLLPFYEREVARRSAAESSRHGVAGYDEEAIFHIACLLLRDTAYIQLGGPDESGRDATNPVSFLVLEAAHRLRIPANVGVCVGPGVDPKLLRRGVEILLADKTGIPKFLGIVNTATGFARNGYPMALAWTRAYSGCHWSAIPGREYTLNDCVKINFGKVFDVALRDLEGRRSVAKLWEAFAQHLQTAVQAIADGLVFHLEHMGKVFPELVIDLLCHGTIEKGLDASEGGVEFYNLCLDGAALATVADSFAAIEQRVEKEKRLKWDELMAHLDANWAGAEGERARLMMKSVPRYGSGGSRADEWAAKIAQTFTRLVKEADTHGRFQMIPGLFSWANTIPMGKGLGATPNARRAGEPISHGANPDPGFRRDGAPTAMAAAIAAVQPAYGNTAPLQIEIDPLLSDEREGVEAIENLIKTHFDLGGTQININVLDADTLRAAHQDPSKYPDLVVRVTGFSAYFASLSPDFRKLVVDRLVTGA
ncbi:MAG: formate acetyltransferase [Planctomycetes bacterium]|nr:formate acetyltransferase [Planctomycetota bacterium]